MPAVADRRRLLPPICARIVRGKRCANVFTPSTVPPRRNADPSSDLETSWGRGRYRRPLPRVGRPPETVLTDRDFALLFPLRDGEPFWPPIDPFPFAFLAALFP
jgi:hypothetical protein